MQRRHALQGALAALGLLRPRAQAAPALSEDLFRRDPEAWWLRLRESEFSLPPDRAFLNNGSLGVPPRPVLKAVTDYLEQSATLESNEYPRWGYEKMEPHRAMMAAYLGCDLRELALMHNATEGMGIVAAGLDLQAGDEVLTTDQEHPSGKGPWQARAARHGIVFREVPLPIPPRNPAELTERLIGAITPRTRVLMFSGILTTTGLVMPVKEICAAARAKGVLTVVDGAHMAGQIPVNLHNLGADVWIGSPHKWLFAPAGSGLLYLRNDVQDRLWPTITTTEWNNKELGAARFMMVGTNNRAVMEGMIAGLRFHQQLGPERIFQRIHQLAQSVRRRALEVPYVELLTPDDDRLYGSLVTMRIKKPDLAKFQAACRKKKIWVYGGELLRVSSHIHTRPSDLDGLFATMRETWG